MIGWLVIICYRNRLNCLDMDLSTVSLCDFLDFLLLLQSVGRLEVSFLDVDNFVS